VPISSHTVPLDDDQVGKLRAVLERDGFEFVDKPHTLYAARKGKLNVSVYRKGPKVLMQGRDTEDFVRFTLEPEILGEARLGYEEVNQPEMFEPHFGIDESGKGDFFGPLVIAGVYTDAASARALLDGGIMDSKRIASAARIRQLAQAIRAVPGIATAVIAIGPERYNELHAKFGNLNRLLAWGHARAIARLAEQRPECPRALSDQFARPELLRRALRQQGVELELEQRVRGESDVAVAAASILARERFVDWIEKSSRAGGVRLPLGASDAVVEAGREVVERHGEAALSRIAKMHFKTRERVLGHRGSDGTESA